MCARRRGETGHTRFHRDKEKPFRAAHIEPLREYLGWRLYGDIRCDLHTPVSGSRIQDCDVPVRTTLSACVCATGTIEELLEANRDSFINHRIRKGHSIALRSSIHNVTGPSVAIDRSATYSAFDVTQLVGNVGWCDASCKRCRVATATLNHWLIDNTRAVSVSGTDCAGWVEQGHCLGGESEMALI